MVRLRLGVCAVLVACNSTNVVAPTIGDDPDPVPGSGTPHRLSQTDDTTIGESMSLACSDANGTLENSYYRVFALRDFNITNTFVINRVNFGVQTALGSQRVKVSVGTYAGDAGVEQLDTTKIDVLAMTTIRVWPTDVGETLQANIPAVEVSPDANLVVEIRSEGHGERPGTYFYLGATKGNETIAGYLRAPACIGPDPLMTTALGFVKSHLIISVSGTD